MTKDLNFELYTTLKALNKLLHVFDIENNKWGNIYNYDIADFEELTKQNDNTNLFKLLNLEIEHIKKKIELSISKDSKILSIIKKL